MAPQTPEARIKIVAENLARAALQEMQRDVKATGTGATGAAVGFEKMVFQNGRLIASTSGARRGLNIMENGLRTLAFSAAGIPGPVGKVASGIGLLGAGSLVVTGVVAGVGAVALGYKLLVRDATAAADAADKLTESLKKQTLGGQFRDLQANLTDAGAGVFAAQSRAQQGITSNPILEWIALIKQGALEDAGEKAVAAALAARDIREQDHAKTIRSLELEARLFGVSAEQAARIRAAAQGFTAEETKRLVVAARNLETKKEEQRTLEAQKNLLVEISQISADISDFFATPGAFIQEQIAAIKVPTLQDLLAQEGGRQATLRTTELQKEGEQFAFGLDERFFDDVQAGVNEAIAQTPGFKEGGRTAGMTMAAAFVTAVGQFQQGGPGGIFGGFGSLLAGAGAAKNAKGVALLGGAAPFLGTAGFALSAVGTLFGMFDHSAERRQREMMEELRRIRQNTDRREQPENVGVHVYVDGQEITDRVLYEIGRATRRDATPRLPPR